MCHNSKMYDLLINVPNAATDANAAISDVTRSNTYTSSTPCSFHLGLTQGD